MTIAVSIRTGAAAVFAADSKLTTSGLVGVDEAGEPRFVNQTYDNATKIVSDAGRTAAMAMVAGSATLGPVSVMDYIAARSVLRDPDPTVHETRFRAFVDEMAAVRADYWNARKIAPDKWPVTAVMFAVAPVPMHEAPAVWRVLLAAEKPTLQKVTNRIYLEGSYDSVYGLLYGYRDDVMTSLASTIKVGEQDVGEEAVYKALESVKVLRPIDKINTISMPIQDAVDLAVFLATAQVQMERFLPGEPACGGPIDVMVLSTSPRQEILWFPGKELRHPAVR